MLQEGRSLETLVQAYQAIPADDKALLEDIQKDIADAGGELFQEMAKASSPVAVRSLNEMLASHQAPDPVDLDGLISDLTEDSMTYLRFYSQLRDRIERQPQLKNRVLSRLKTIEADLKAKNIKLFVPGERIVNTLGIIMSVIGCSYAFKISFLPDEGSAHAFASGLSWTPLMFTFLIATSLTGEVLAMKAALVRSIDGIKQLYKNRRVVKNLRILTQEMVISEESQGLFKTVEYFASDRAAKDYEKLLPVMLERQARDIQDLREDSNLWNDLVAFSQTTKFVDTIKFLNQNLSHSQKYDLTKKLELSEVPRVWEINSKLVSAEMSLMQDFERYLQNNHPKALVDLKQYNARKQAEFNEAMSVAAEPKSSYNKSIGLSSLGIGIFGLVAAYGPHPEMLDGTFGLAVANWVRVHTHSLIFAAGFLNVPGLAHFYWRAYKTWGRMKWLKKILSQTFSESVVFESISRTVDRVALGTRYKTNYPQTTSLDTVEEFYKDASDNAQEAGRYQRNYLDFPSAPKPRINSCKAILL